MQQTKKKKFFFLTEQRKQLRVAVCFGDPICAPNVCHSKISALYALGALQFTRLCFVCVCVSQHVWTLVWFHHKIQTKNKCSNQKSLIIISVLSIWRKNISFENNFTRRFFLYFSFFHLFIWSFHSKFIFFYQKPYNIHNLCFNSLFYFFLSWLRLAFVT